MNTMTIECHFHFDRAVKGRKELEVGPKPPAPKGRVPRVARLMALAIRFEQLLRDGVVRDYAELADLGHVSRARVTQVMNLLNLAPDIQEAILFLPETTAGRDPIKLADLQPVAMEVEWGRQRRRYPWDLTRDSEGY